MRCCRRPAREHVRLFRQRDWKLAEIAKECGREPIKIEVEWGKAFRAPMLEEALQKNPDVECVFMTHSETSTGVLNPLFELAAGTRARGNVMLCVDAVSSLSTSR